MSSEPWKKWIPGVLSPVQMKALFGKYVLGVEEDNDVDFSSFDLHIGNECFLLEDGPIKPERRQRYMDTISGKYSSLALNDDYYELEVKKTYIFRLREKLFGLDEKEIHGRATAKSSIGRLDTLVRLVVDYMGRYESFDKPKQDGDINMYIEVTPLSFSLKVKPGFSFNQLRLFYGHPDNCIITGKEVYRTCFPMKNKDELDQSGETLSVDLTPEEYGTKSKMASGFKANIKMKGGTNVLTLEKGAKHKPEDWWEPELIESSYISLGKDEFYILKSKELISLPHGVAVYARASDEELGEMRIHYAGFIHPLFGWDREDDVKGTPLIFEVRGHDIPTNLRHGEVMAKLLFYRMSSEDGIEATPTRDDESPYGTQTLQLSKYFADWE